MARYWWDRTGIFLLRKFIDFSGQRALEIVYLFYCTCSPLQQFLLLIMKRYAISDIHGCIRTFRCLVEDKLQLKRDDELYLLGDYIDRGPDSKGVIDFILELKDNGFNVHALRGNHEEMMLNALRDPAENYELWFYNGGYDTLKSFALEKYGRYGLHAGLFDDKYIRFLEQLEYYFRIDGYYLVHAGMDFSLEDPFVNRKIMLWTRTSVYDKRYLEERRLVHGHTPTAVERIRASVNERIINIDGGCVFGEMKGLGNLVALDLDASDIIALPSMEKPK